MHKKEWGGGWSQRERDEEIVYKESNTNPEAFCECLVVNTFTINHISPQQIQDALKKNTY